MVYFLINYNIYALFSFKLTDLLYLWVLIPLSIILLFINKLLYYKLIIFKKMSLNEFLTTSLFATVLISIPEEILFRGLIQNYFVNIFQSDFLIVFFSSLVFAFAHILNEAKSFSFFDWNFKLVVLVFVIGLFLGYVYLATHSLFIPVIIHGFIIVISRFLNV